MAQERFLGVDFSGGASAWRVRCARPSVWIACIDDGALASLEPVQALAGPGQPFDRLVNLMARGEFCAAGVDAPFSLPAAHMPEGGHPELLRIVEALAPADDRPFPRGAELVAAATARAPLASAKPVRATEAVWRGRGVNVRSTLWNGPRGGAPFAAAALTLLARASRPIWPWRREPGMLVEAFPAAQLQSWGLPHTRYARPDDVRVRASLISALADRVSLPREFLNVMRAEPDALDATLAAFGARAAALGPLRDAPPEGWALEGAIAVHA